MRALLCLPLFEHRQHRERLGNPAFAPDVEVVRNREDRDDRIATHRRRQSAGVSQRRVMVILAPGRENPQERIVAMAARERGLHGTHRVEFRESGQDDGLGSTGLVNGGQGVGFREEPLEGVPAGVAELLVRGWRPARSHLAGA